MSKKHNKQNIDKNKAKKAVVLGKDKPNRTPLIALAIGVVLGAAVVAYYLGTQSSNDGTANAEGPRIVNETAVVFPAAMFSDGMARHFEYVDGARTIRYFILKSSDGVLRAAFDACDVCWPAGKGYYQEGDKMVCRNCGRKFASVLVNEVKGGCNPAPLTRQLDNDQLVIQIKDIQEGGQYFDFKGKVSS
jgi:uncharacterized membrane protein